MNNQALRAEIEDILFMGENEKEFDAITEIVKIVKREVEFSQRIDQAGFCAAIESTESQKEYTNKFNLEK